MAIQELSPLKMTQEVLQIVREYNASSLPEYTSPTRLNPIVIIDNSLLMLADDSLKNAVQTVLSIFSAHYLQAIALTTKINDIKTIEILDQFSTDRSGTISATGGGYERFTGNNSFKLPSYDDVMPGLEAGDKTDDLNKHVNLAIGRLLHVELGVGKEKVTIPVNVVVNPMVVDSKVLPNILANSDQDTSFIGRWHKWRAGEIDSFVDYIFALDLIEKDRKALLNDDSGVYKEARDRKVKGIISAVLSGRGSVNNASAMAIISKSTAEDLELALKGRLKSPRARDKYFKTTNSMLLMVMDPRKERIKIYQRGIAEVGDYTFSDIEKVNSRSDALDINSLLKAYKLGESPTL